MKMPPTSSSAGIASALALLSLESSAAVNYFEPVPDPYPFVDGSSNLADGSVQLNGGVVDEGYFSSSFVSPNVYFCSTNHALWTTYHSQGGVWEYAVGTDARTSIVASSFTPGSTATEAMLTGFQPDITDINNILQPAHGTHFYIVSGFRAAGSGDPYNLSWIELSTSLDASSNWVLNVHGWAYETTPGASIVVGQIPEPSSAFLALVGTAFLFNVRRR